MSEKGRLTEMLQNCRLQSVKWMHAYDGDFVVAKALFRCTQNSKTLQDSQTSHRIFERMHEVLNVAKQNN